MGLFYNKKKACPTCGCAVPRFWGMKIEGIKICEKCREKIDLPGEKLKKITIADFREYLDFYEKNEPFCSVCQGQSAEKPKN